MNTVHSTTKIKKSAKVIKYQNELRKELIKLNALIEEVDGQIIICRTEIEELRTTTFENSKSSQELLLKQHNIEIELRLLHKKRDECISKIDNIEKELADVLYLNEILYSDVNPYEVVEMITPNKWIVRELDATLKPEAKRIFRIVFALEGLLAM